MSINCLIRIFPFVLLALSSCAHQSVVLKEKNEQVVDTDFEINSNLRLGFKSSKWYYVPYEASTNYYDIAHAKECFLTDYGPDHFSEGLARFVENNKMGLINEKGEVIIAAKYDYISQIENHLAVVCLGCLKDSDEKSAPSNGANWGVIDDRGKIVVPIVYSEIDFDPWAKKISVRTDAKSNRKHKKRKNSKIILLKSGD